MKQFLLALAAVMMAACGGTKSEAPSGPAMQADLVNGAIVTGKVAFQGTAPKPVVLDMSDKPECVKANDGKPVYSQEVVVNPNGTLKNVFVWVKAGLPNATWKAPATPVELDQKGCMYDPHVLGVMTNQPLEIRNSDPTNHNIHATGDKNGELNESQMPGEAPIVKTFAKPELFVSMKCNVHPWMRSYIGVVAHPFFAVTGDDGTFTIKGLPSGTYTIEIVHEKYGKQEQQVTVGARDNKTVDFSVKG